MGIQVMFVHTFFVASFVVAFPLLAVGVQVNVQFRVLNETLVTFFTIKSVIQVFVAV